MKEGSGGWLRRSRRQRPSDLPPPVPRDEHRGSCTTETSLRPGRSSTGDGESSSGRTPTPRGPGRLTSGGETDRETGESSRGLWSATYGTTSTYSGSTSSATPRHPGRPYSHRQTSYGSGRTPSTVRTHAPRTVGEGTDRTTGTPTPEVIPPTTSPRSHRVPKTPSDLSGPNLQVSEDSSRGSQESRDLGPPRPVRLRLPKVGTNL